jgi:hypothetical protein
MGKSIIDNIQFNINQVHMRSDITDNEKALVITEYERQKQFFSKQIHFINKNINEGEILKVNSEISKQILTAPKSITKVESSPVMEPNVAAFMNAAIDQKLPVVTDEATAIKVEESPVVSEACEEPSASQSSNSINLEEILNAMKKILNTQ